MKYMQGQATKELIREEKEDIKSWEEILKHYSSDHDGWALEDKERDEKELLDHKNALKFLENFEFLSQYNDEGEELYVNHANHRFLAIKPGTYFVLWIDPSDVEKWLDDEKMPAPLDTHMYLPDRYIKEYKAMNDFEKLVARVKFNYRQVGKYTVPRLVDPLKREKEMHSKGLEEPISYLLRNK